MAGATLAILVLLGRQSMIGSQGRNGAWRQKLNRPKILGTSSVQGPLRLYSAILRRLKNQHKLGLCPWKCVIFQHPVMVKNLKRYSQNLPGQCLPYRM